tara:strand:+ start:133 stop:378 length:246 start_codon:yes stop_codon:yes gene_type:complete
MTTSESDILDMIAHEALVDRNTLVLASKLDEIGIDSIAVVSVIFEVEEKYNITIGDDDISVDQTLGDVLEMIISKINAAAA